MATSPICEQMRLMQTVFSSFGSDGILKNHKGLPGYELTLILGAEDGIRHRTIVIGHDVWCEQYSLTDPSSMPENSP